MVKLLAFPERDVQDIPRGLRALADRIEKGECGASHVLAWVVDCGDGRIDVGCLGAAAEPGAVAYYLYGLAMRKLEAV